MQHYQNPYLLHYCVLEDLPAEIEKQIIQKAEILLGEATLELAVIGSSHFLHLPNCFCELLTCAPPLLTKALFSQQQVKENFEFTHSFRKLKVYYYAFSLFFHHFKKNEFDVFEKNILNQPALLCQTFEKESAITSIQVLENQKNKIEIQTWHTYPETLIAVQTQSSIVLE